MYWVLFSIVVCIFLTCSLYFVLLYHLNFFNHLIQFGHLDHSQNEWGSIYKDTPFMGYFEMYFQCDYVAYLNLNKLLFTEKENEILSGGSWRWRWQKRKVVFGKDGGDLFYVKEQMDCWYGFEENRHYYPCT